MRHSKTTRAILVACLLSPIGAGSCTSDSQIHDAMATASRLATSPGWSRLPNPPLSPRSGATVEYVDGRVIVLGGSDQLCPPDASCTAPIHPPFDDGAILDLATSTWSPIAPLPFGVNVSSSAVVGGKVFLLGSCAVEPSCTNSPQLLRYSPDDYEWDTFPAPVEPTRYLLAPFEDDLVAFTATDQFGSYPDYVFHEPEERWLPLPNDPLPETTDRRLTASSGKLYLFGAVSAVADTAVAYDPVLSSWQVISTGRAIAEYVWQADSRVYLSSLFAGGLTILDTTSGVMEDVQPPPQQGPEVHPTIGILGNEWAIYEGPAGRVFDADSSNWFDIEPHPGSQGLLDETLTSAGRAMFVFGGARWSESSSGSLPNEAWLWTPPI